MDKIFNPEDGFIRLEEFYPERGSRKFLRNIVIHLPNYALSYQRRS
jgi:hypothetical protein